MITPSPSTGCPVGVVGFVEPLNSIFDAAITPSPWRVPVSFSFASGAIVAHVPFSYDVAVDAVMVYGPTMKLRFGHDVPATSEDTVTSADTGVVGVVGVESCLNVRPATRMKFSPSLLEPEIATLAPVLRSAHEPAVYCVAYDTLKA